MDGQKNERVTMRTLAERLGVTKTTVSLALRGHPSISKGTREKVMLLAREMNYRPDPAVAAIAAQRWSGGTPERHRIIAFLCDKGPDGRGIQAWYFPGAKQRAEELGYKLEPFTLAKFPTAKSIDRTLYARGVRGVIVPPISDPSSTRAMDLDWDKITAVCAGVGRVRPPLHTVTSDIFTTTRLVWEVAAKAGYRKIGAALYFHTPIADDDWMRIGASSAAIQLLGLDEAAKIPFLSSHILDADALMNWYNRYKPELIIGFNQATGITLQECGVQIPQDVKFISLYTPPGSRWSGIAHHYDQVGRTSVDVLNAELRDNRWGLPQLPNLTLIKPVWNCGETFPRDSLGSRYIFDTTRSLLSSDNLIATAGGAPN